MKLSNETKVGILGVISLVVLFYGYNFLKGRNLISSSLVVYAKFDRVDALPKSAPIRYRGLQVGVVTNIELESGKDFSDGKVIVTLSLNKGLRIPKTAIANIVQPSIMGTNELDLVFDKPCVEGCLENYDYIRGTSSGGYLADAVNSIGPQVDSIKMDLMQTTRAMVGMIDSLMAGTLTQVTDNGLGQSMLHLKSIMANLDALSATLNKTMAGSSANLSATLANVESITHNLRDNNAKITGILANTESLTTSFKNETMGKVNGTLDGAKTTMADLRKTMEEVNKAVANITLILDKAKTPDNTLGMLLSDPKFATDLRTTVEHTGLLLQDFRLNPKRYIRLFKPKAPAYQPPVEDPGLKK